MASNFGASSLPLMDNQTGATPAFNQEAPVPVSISLSPEEERDIVRQCVKYKRSVVDNAKPKKEIMRRLYAYYTGKLADDDLLPSPASAGNKSQNDSNNKNRPKLFIPITLEAYKNLYAKVKGTLFPNDDDFCKVIALDQQFVPFEYALTKGFLQKMEDIQFSEECGKLIQDLIIFGTFAAFPTLDDCVTWEWKLEPAQPVPATDPMTGEVVIDPMTGMPQMMPSEEPPTYIPIENDTPSYPDFERFRVLDFYPDPAAKKPEKAKWVYLGQKTVYEMQDSTLYINLDKVKQLERTERMQGRTQDIINTSSINDLTDSYSDVDSFVDYDLYYLPYLKTMDGKVYRNMIIGIVSDQVLVRFHPNIMPDAMNPCVYTTWMNDPDSPFGISPLQDIMGLQRMVNIIYNYLIETLSRIGNRFMATQGTDLTNLFGAAGGVAFVPEGGMMQAFTGDYAEIQNLLNFVEVLVQKAQSVAGGQNFFQAGTSQDFQKTATEMNLMSEEALGIVNEAIQHIAVTGIEKILQSLLVLCGQYAKEEEVIRVDDPRTGTQWIPVDFSILQQGKFKVKLTGINPGMSKAAQVNSMMQILQLCLSHPPLAMRLRNDGFEFVKDISVMQGLDDIDDAFLSEEELQEKQMMMAQQAQEEQMQQFQMQKAMQDDPDEKNE